MTYAIIGTGNIASGLARTLAPKNKVLVAGRDADKAKNLVRDIKNASATSITEALDTAQIVFLAVPFEAVSELAAQYNFDDKIVVDVTNPFKADFSGLTFGYESSAAEEIAQLLPRAHVVKALNTIFAQVYEQGLNFEGRRVPAYVAADNDEAKQKVIEGLSQVGFDAVDTGGLLNARYLEPLAYLNVQFGYMLGQGTQIAPAWLSRQPA